MRLNSSLKQTLTSVHVATGPDVSFSCHPARYLPSPSPYKCAFPPRKGCPSARCALQTSNSDRIVILLFTICGTIQAAKLRIDALEGKLVKFDEISAELKRVEGVLGGFGVKFDDSEGALSDLEVRESVDVK